MPAERPGTHPVEDLTRRRRERTEVGSRISRALNSSIDASSKYGVPGLALGSVVEALQARAGRDGWRPAGPGSRPRPRHRRRAPLQNPQGRTRGSHSPTPRRRAPPPPGRSSGSPKPPPPGVMMVTTSPARATNMSSLPRSRSCGVPAFSTTRAFAPGLPPAMPQGRNTKRSMPRPSTALLPSRTMRTLKTTPVPPRQRPAPPESGRSA